MFNNVLGIEKGSKGCDLLESGKNHLAESYAEVHQIENEKVVSIVEQDGFYDILTNKSEYRTRIAVLALNYSKPFSIKGLESYIIPHQRANPVKDRVQLKNNDHLMDATRYLVASGLDRACVRPVASIAQQQPTSYFGIDL